MSTVASLTATANAANSVANTVGGGNNPLGSLTNALSSAAGSKGGAAGATGSSSAAANSASATFGNNFNTFLTLLTTQLQNQDPLSPLDTNQFTQQLVEFSQVEQQINTNTNLTSLIAQQGQGDLIAAQQLVGKTVALNDAKAPLTNGQASYSYSLPANAAKTALAITNAQGAVVWAGTGETAAGAHNFTWNGQNLSGTTQPDGSYTLQVAAVAADGSALTPTVTSLGTVQSVTSQNGAPALSIGGATYPLSELAGVQDPAS